MSDPVLRLMPAGSAASPDVARWQELLLQRGFHPGNADGVFGFRTEVATRAFQQAHELTADGIVGPQTWAAAERDDPQSTPRIDAGEVPRVATPLTDRGIVEALRDGHVAALGGEPSHGRVMVAWSQVALETAHGRSLWCNNFGNISAFSWSGDYYVLRVKERVCKDPEQWKCVDMHFRAYDRAKDGAADYWHLMHDRYPSALARFDAGDPGGAARELGRLGYFTAYVDPYAETMTKLYEAWSG